MLTQSHPCKPQVGGVATRVQFAFHGISCFVQQSRKQRFSLPASSGHRVDAIDRGVFLVRLKRIFQRSLILDPWSVFLGWPLWLSQLRVRFDVFSNQVGNVLQSNVNVFVKSNKALSREAGNSLKSEIEIEKCRINKHARERSLENDKIKRLNIV